MGCQSSKNTNTHIGDNDVRRVLVLPPTRDEQQQYIEWKNRNYRKFLQYESFLIKSPNSVGSLIKGIIGNYWDLGDREHKTENKRLGWRREHIRSVLRTVPYATEFRFINNIRRMTTKQHMMDYIDYLADSNAIRTAYYFLDNKPALRFCVHDWGLDANKREWRMEQIMNYDDNRTIEALIKLNDRKFSIIRHRFAYRITRLGRGM
jgi:hypothetical protein